MEETITVLLAILKLAGVLDLSWLCVLAPIWIPWLSVGIVTGAWALRRP